MNLVILSGGQDSSTALAHMMTSPQHEQHRPTLTIHYQYGQRHKQEREYAQYWASKYDLPMLTLTLPTLGDSALTRPSGDLNQPHPHDASSPASFVPARNLLFMTLAAALAYEHGIPNITMGISEADNSGYPDCRADAIHAQQEALRLGMNWPQLTFHTPLISKTKAATFQLAKDAGVLSDVITHTLTCYQGDTTQHEYGRGCGNCPACRLRSAGWNQYNARA